MNLPIASSMVWHLSSSCIIKFLLVITFFTSSIVPVLSAMSSSCNSYLFFELNNWIILEASFGIFPSSTLTLRTFSRASLTKSFCSKITCVDGQISLTESMILAHSFSFSWESGSFSVNSFYNFFILSVILFDFCT